MCILGDEEPGKCRVTLNRGNAVIHITILISFPGSLPRTLCISVVKCTFVPGTAVLVPQPCFYAHKVIDDVHWEIGHPWMKSADALSPHECIHDIPIGYTFSDPSSDRRDIPNPSNWQWYENLQCYLLFAKTTREIFRCQSLPIDHCGYVLFVYISIVWTPGLKCENKILELEFELELFPGIDTCQDIPGCRHLMRSKWLVA